MSAAAGAAGGVDTAGPGLAAGRVGRGSRFRAVHLFGFFGVFAFDARDGWLVAGTAAYATALGGALALGSAARGGGWWIHHVAAIVVLATGLVWMSNTISHIHLHTPIFRAALANRAFSMLLTVLLGIPQGRWKRRHLRHHGLAVADRPWWSGTDGVEIGMLVALWAAGGFARPAAFLGTLAPAWLLGLALCAVQGHYEHAGGRDGGVDHHGRIYNRLWFNDGYHVAHHLAPGTHWTDVSRITRAANDHASSDGSVSAWPPLLRWLDLIPSPSWLSSLVLVLLDRLETAALSSRLVRGLLLRTHGPALDALVREIGSPPPRRVCIVGGGLFPRTAILLARILPEAELVIVDGDPAHLRAARRVLEGELGSARGVSFVTGVCDGEGASVPGEPVGAARPLDLLVVPLALRGAREPFYRPRPGCDVLVHDWMWHRRGDAGRLVSPLLLKRLNLVRDPQRAPRAARNLDSLSTVASVVEARCEPPCRTTALPTPTQPPRKGPASSTTRPSPASDEEIGRRS